MKHKVTIEGDMNDADYTSESFVVDLDSQFSILWQLHRAL